MDGLNDAASIFTLVQSGISFVKTIKQVADGGLSCSNTSRALSAERLTNLISEVSRASRQPRSGNNLHERQISKLSQESVQVSLELRALLDQVSADLSSPLLSSARKALRAIFQEGKIKPLDERLQRLSQDLQLHMIAVLKDDSSSVSMKVDELLHQQGALQLANSAAINASRDQLLALSQALKNLAEDGAASDETRHAQLTSYLNNLSTLLTDGKEQKHLLKLLHFRDINNRRALVENVSQYPLNWIFDQSHAHRPLGFSDWLEQSSQEMFWITGKAGCGKSVMVERMSRMEGTTSRLETWAGQLKVVTVSHFFWAPGAPLERSIEGLLRSLLFQLLSSCPTAHRAAREVLYDGKLPDSVDHESWSIPKLRSALDSVIQHLSNTVRFCFFLDGLDECDGNLKDLIRHVRDLNLYPSVKICVSSRTWSEFEQGLAVSPSNRLHLHAHTIKDIKSFASQRLKEDAGIQDLFFAAERGPDDRSLSYRQQRWKSLLSDISTRAEGVFLWAALVGAFHLAPQANASLSQHEWL